MLKLSILLCVSVFAALQPAAPAVTEGDFVIRDFRFTSGETLPELRMHYRTLGHAAEGRDRASCATPCSSCTAPAAPARSSPAPGSPASCSAPASRSTPRSYFIILPDDIGHGSRASRATACARSFPRYGYRDMVRGRVPAAHRRPRRQSPAAGDGHVDGRHAHLAVGRALSGLHGRADAARQPADADLRPQPRLAARRHRRDPQRSASGRAATTATQPQSLRTAAQMLLLMSSNPVLRQKPRADAGGADRVIDRVRRELARRPATRTTCCTRSKSSRDYDPGPGLEKIPAPLLAINSADDLINPPELRILEREIKRVAKGGRSCCR